MKIGITGSIPVYIKNMPCYIGVWCNGSISVSKTEDMGSSPTAVPIYLGIKEYKYSKSKIAYMCTEPFYYDYMRISDVEKYYADFFEDFNRDKFRNLLQFMELDASMKVKALSSGMAAKLKISATLAREAEVIMLDEPLNGIDLLGRDQIINAVIKATNPGSTFIISSHLFDELENIVDNVVMVKHGNVVLEGDLEDIRAQYGKSISDLYREIYGSNDGLSDEIWGK